MTGEQPMTATEVRERATLALRTIPEPLTLYVFRHHHAARYSGFREDGRHRNPAWSGERAWWPSREVEALYHLELARIIVTDGVHRWLADATAAERDRYGYALHILQSRLRVPPMVWIEL